MAPTEVKSNVVAHWRGRLRVRSRLRHWWRGWNPRWAGWPRVLANGIPKAGTHLLVRCIELLPGMVREELELYELRLRERLGEVEPAGGKAVVQVSIGGRRFVEQDALRTLLKRLRPGEFTGGHMPYSQEFDALLGELGFRTLLIIRDPRDMVVSRVFHIFSRPHNPAHDYFAHTLKSDDDRLLAIIRGTGSRLGGGIRERLEVFLPWLRKSLNYTTRFELLVGPQGGGSADAQRAEVKRIAEHVGFHLPPAQIESLASNLFWEDSPTFRQGKIGSWREHFKEEHKAAFKQVAGQMLIELGYEKNLDW